ncbi:carbohydrate porin [Paracraurococcus lichenis]|uniref:Carbohydrate porin n=1 Tax=Paracraurococcus lichenis TaxID=3064888 RepID=A0ABT9DUR6_9PROT|nr:carbohydrate porin [Paracraurococcus sp. LOR1-02]MDO9707535.1 carbohydrate porin [Paracraurococcus sp. LOR1-02]
MNRSAIIGVVLALLPALPALGQHGGSRGTGAPPLPPEAPAIFPDLAARQDALEAAGWLIRGQSTFVQQFHPSFHAPYRGENSLGAGDQGRNTLSLDIVVGRRLWEGAEVIIDPQVSRGYGLSGTRGVAAFPNGEAFRIGSDWPTIYVARAFLRQTIALTAERDGMARDPLRFGGTQPRERITITAGKFPVFDIFDDNSYAHDPRTQFLNWAFASAGAFDFANDAKGFTNGVAIEWDNTAWGLRAGAFQVAKRINSLSLDPKPFRGFQLLAQADRFYQLGGRPGALRLLYGLSRTRAQRWDALVEGDIEATEVSPDNRSTVKHMLVLNGEQELREDLGAFARVSWNDGRTQNWMYTEMDWAASAGLSWTGLRWGRPDDTVGLAGNIGGLSRSHQRFLEAGGLGFITGDGRLRYRPELAAEAYYRWRLAPGTDLTGDLQLFGNPAYNADRGPVAVLGVRLRTEF